MEIKKKLTENTQNPISPPNTAAQTPITHEQKKTESVGLSALGNLMTSKTSSSELKINMELLNIELHAIENMLFFALDPLAGLILTEDPGISSMLKVGNQFFIKEGHLDAILSHLDKNDYQIGPVDFRNLDQSVIPEELWGELHIQIGNLKPLIIAIVPETSETAATHKKEISNPKQTPQPSLNQPRTEVNSSSKSIKWQQAMMLFVDETNKILKATKERHEREKTEDALAHKEEIIKKEIEAYDQKLSRIKESTTQEEMLSHIKEWSESLPPCPIRLLNAMTMWRELVNKCLVENAVG